MERKQRKQWKLERMEGAWEPQILCILRACIVPSGLGTDGMGGGMVGVALHSRACLAVETITFA